MEVSLFLRNYFPNFFICKQLLAFILVLSPGLTVGQNIYSRSQFEKPLDTITDAVTEAEKKYKKVEKSVKTLFPKESRQSPFYLLIKQDFKTYRESMKDLDRFKVSLTDNHKEYKKLFSAGLFKSVDAIRFGDSNWDRVEAVATFLDNTLEETEKGVNSVQPLQKQLSSFIERMDEVMESIEEVKTSAKESKKAYEKAVRKNKELQQKFASVDTGLTKYSAYGNADRVNEELNNTINTFSELNDAISRLNGNITRLVRGKGRPGEEKRVWEIYREIVVNHAMMTTNLVEINQETGILQEKLKDVLNLLYEFGESLAEIENDISELINRQRQSEENLEADRRRNSSLLSAKPKGISLRDFPYQDLNDAFQYSEQILSGTGNSIVKVTRIRGQFVELAGRMNFLKENKRQYDQFRQYKKEFKDIFKKVIKQYNEHQDAREKFEAVIIDNFLNTQEYWNIKYVVDEKKSFGGNLRIEENYGYLFDINEYYEQPYHGKLISSYQLRLKMEKSKGQRDWTYTFIFEGSEDFPIEGMALVSGGMVLFEFSRDAVNVMDEKRDKKGKVNFVWELSVGKKKIIKLVESDNLDLKIHLMTTTHRVAHMLHLQKIFKNYTIPPERLIKWREMVLEEKV
ncbi:MAG: hypothetical protein IIA61_05455 [Candidatus Marinimicrobia bacterium]|nr:hypothetical protein [Candidatus Neomarinimicrobiota bacterium]